LKWLIPVCDTPVGSQKRVPINKMRNKIKNTLQALSIEQLENQNEVMNPANAAAPSLEIKTFSLSKLDCVGNTKVSDCEYPTIIWGDKLTVKIDHIGTESPPTAGCEIPTKR